MAALGYELAVETVTETPEHERYHLPPATVDRIAAEGERVWYRQRGE